MNLAKLLYQGSLITLLSSRSTAEMIWSTTVCGGTGGAKKVKNRDVGRRVLENRGVWVKEGRTRVVRTPRVLYLCKDSVSIQDWVWRLTVRRARTGGIDGGSRGRPCLHNNPLYLTFSSNASPMGRTHSFGQPRRVP